MKNMKRALIALLIIGLISVTVKSCMAVLPKKNLKPSDYDIGMTMQDAQAAGLPIITVFYADWCTYCSKFMPRLDMARNMYKGRYNVVLVNTDLSRNKKISNEYRVSYLPTVYIIDPKYDYSSHIDSDYLDTIESFSTELDKYAKIRRLLDKGNRCTE